MIDDPTPAAPPPRAVPDPIPAASAARSPAPRVTRAPNASVAVMLPGIAGGVGVAIAGAAVWAGVAAATNTRIGFVGLGIGIGVAWVFIRYGLRGPGYACLAAVLSLVGCALGDVGAGTLIASSATGTDAATVLSRVPITTLMNVNGLDAFLYAIAAYSAYRRVVR